MAIIFRTAQGPKQKNKSRERDESPIFGYFTTFSVRMSFYVICTSMWAVEKDKIADTGADGVSRI